VENLLGTGDPTEQAVVQIRQDLLDVIGDVSHTLFEVASSHHAAAAVSFGFPEGRHHWRSGPDGADLALLDVFESDWQISRFDEVVIASGDGIFTTLAAAVASSGVKCTVVSRRAGLSARLALAATTIVFLGDPIIDEGQADAA
jgi:hypothetical protein